MHKSHKINITVAIPVKNEQLNLDRCIQRLKRFREVVVIDSGSTDGTKEIAENHGARVIDFKWNGKFPKKRNWFLLNFSVASDWVLFLDADEFVSDEFCDEIDTATRDGDCNGYWLKYTNYFLGRKMRFGVPQRKLALFKVGSGLYEQIDEHDWSQLDMEIHEHPIIDGKIGQIYASVDHQDMQGISRFVGKHREYALWEARRFAELENSPEIWQQFTQRQRFKYRNLDKFWYPWFYFIFSYFVKLGLLDGSVGFHYAFFKTWYFQTIRLLIADQRSKEN